MDAAACLGDLTQGRKDGGCGDFEPAGARAVSVEKRCHNLSAWEGIAVELERQTTLPPQADAPWPRLLEWKALNLIL